MTFSSQTIMAALSLSQTLAITSTKYSSNRFSRNKPSINPNNNAYSPISCTSNNNDENPKPQQPGKLDRRNILVGLGGLYSATELFWPGNLVALADPVSAPDISKCGAADLPADALPIDCCPPTSPDIIDFAPLPPGPAGLRVRPAAHSAGRAYVAKYEKALELMKALPDSDPRCFSQQADIHCDYCNGAYDQTGHPGVELQVHGSWLFFPFHRWYLYFYERILGKLVGDPDFAIPYWNWDAPPGMQMPAMFANPSSPLHDGNRSPRHQLPYAVDLDYSRMKDLDAPPKPFRDQAEENMATIYRQMVSAARTPELFFGGDCRAGDEPESSPRSIENIPHGPVHVWSGDETQANGEDMGNFYSAGRDPMFYAHHANVDRMWALWKTLPGGRRQDFSDPDWLDAAFLFFNEDARLVRVKVRDCVDTRRLGYIYEPVDVPWLKARPQPSKPRPGRRGTALAAGTSPEFPVRLEKAVTVPVARPNKKGRAKKDSNYEEEEVLVVYGIGFDRNSNIKFDVDVNDEDESSPGKSEFAGSFVSVPCNTKNKEKTNTSLKIGISELIKDIGAEDDDEVLVTLVPKSGTVSIGGIKIVFS